MARRWNRLGEDKLAQASFAMVAVALLVATAATGTLIAKKELDKAEERHRDKVLNAMGEAIDKVVQELGLCAASRAQQVVSGWAEFPVNESKISDAFSDEVLGYVHSSFPRVEGGFEVGVSNWTGGLFYVERKTTDLVPADAGTKKQLAIEGEQMEYIDLPPSSQEVLAERTVNPYYVAIGNFTVAVTEDDISLSRECSFERPIVSALPFLESKLRAFESSSIGEFSDLGKAVAYMLTALCELRVLQGYGQPMYSGGLDSTSILTELDVYRAVAVGLLIEQARLFRSVDQEFLDEVSQACAGGYPGGTALLGSKGRELDPAELFLWFLGITEVSLDPQMIMAQTMFGISDQLTIKLMEYMGWLGVLDSADSFADWIGGTIDSVVSRLTGEDNAQESVVSWLTKTIEAGGADRDYFSYLFSADPDYLVYVPEKVYFVEDAAGDIHPVWVGNVSVPVNIPTYDLLSSALWAEFYADFKECQTTFTQLVTDGVMRLAFDLASYAEVRIDGVAIDPADGKDLFSELSEGIGRVSIAFDAGSRLGADLPMFSAQYELTTRFEQFLRSRWLELVDRQGLVQAAFSELVCSVLASARYSYIPDLVVPVEQQLEDIVLSDISNDGDWGVGGAAAVSLDGLSGTYLECLSIIANSSIARADDGFAGPVVDSVARFLASGADGFPGLERILEAQLTSVARSIVAQQEFSGHKRSVRADTSGEFELWQGERSSAEASGRLAKERLSVTVPGGLPPMQRVPYDPSAGYGSLERLFPTDNMLVQVQMPWEFDGSVTEYPNMHMTSLDNFSATPYTTQWTVSVLGTIGISVSAANHELKPYLMQGPASSSSNVRVELSFPVVVQSAWPLQGVEYNPSNTVLSDSVALANRFLAVVWDKVEPVAKWLMKGFEAVYRFFEDVFETISSFATRVVKALTAAMQIMTETLQEYVRKFADSAIGRALQVFLDLSGRAELRITVHGFVIIVQTHLPDLIYRQGSDLLRIIVCTDRFGPGLAFGVRFARLSDGSYDILANATIALRSVRIDVSVDPFMFIKRRFVEAHAQAETWALDLVMPEAEPYERAGVSTSDIPGLGAILSNIQLPALGLSAAVEAGMELKYSPPFPTDIVVNEFESNPYGEDSGREWVELYNPLKEAKSVDGWRLETVHGKSAGLDLKGSIPGNGLLVFTFPEASIDNGEPGDPFNDGDAIVLMDPTGATVDLTPIMRDANNDGRTVQRAWDGGGRWSFREGSMGRSNGVPVILATSDFIAKALFEAFREAFVETDLSEVHASLDFVVLFSKRVLNNFIENLLALVGEIIHEVVFYLEVTLNDATGAAGVGFRTSFVVTGDAIVDLLRWLIHTFATFVVNLGRPSCPLSYPAFPESFFEDLYVSFEVFFRMGMPNMVRLLGAVGPLDQEYRCVVSISPNIPTIGRLVGRDWGDWSVEFGAYLEGVPRQFAMGFLAKDTGDLMDFWLVKGRLYGV